MNDQELEIIIERAAKEGAKTALKEVGLNDEHAYDDVRALRSLLDSWRASKTTIWQTTAKIVTTAVLTALSVGIYFTWGDK